MDKLELGKKKIKEVLGADVDSLIASFNEISPDFAKYVVEMAYGDFYSRAGLSDKTREVAAIAALIGQGNTGLPLHAHLKGMLNVGWSKEEIVEVLIFLIVFVGFPPIVDALNVAKEVFAAA